jgi:hypothetical protein
MQRWSRIWWVAAFALALLAWASSLDHPAWAVPGGYTSSGSEGAGDGGGSGSESGDPDLPQGGGGKNGLVGGQYLRSGSMGAVSSTAVSPVLSPAERARLLMQWFRLLFAVRGF